MIHPDPVHHPEPRDLAAQQPAAGIDDDAEPHSPMRLALSYVASDVSIADWDDLFRAVTARLALLFDRPATAAESARIRAGVLECVQALDQLRTTMTHELVRRHQTGQ